jgi:anti-sigma factor RsiW
MADCKEYELMISSYVDGELSEKETEALLAHLDSCASCRALLSVYRNISEAAGESMLEVPDGFSASIMKKVKEMPAEPTLISLPARLRKFRPAIISIAAAAACLALVFLVSPKLFGSGGSGNNATMAAKDNVTIEATQEDSAGAVQNTALKDALPETDGTYGAATVPPADTGASSNGGLSSESQTASDEAPEAPESQMGLMGAPGSGEKGSAPTPAIKFSVSDQTLREYYAVFTIKGTLPDLLADANRTANSDGTASLVITAETAKQLIKDGYTAVMGNEKADKALVNYSAE